LEVRIRGLLENTCNDPQSARGKWGEHAAADYLKGRGYEIVAGNVRTPYGEIDLIAKKDGFVIFVEVKARTSKTFGPPEIAVTPRKQLHMLSCAEHYAQQNAIDTGRLM